MAITLKDPPSTCLQTLYFQVSFRSNAGYLSWFQWKSHRLAEKIGLCALPISLVYTWQIRLLMYVSESMTRGCQPQKSHWSPCSKSCGWGISYRHKTTKECKSTRESRLCKVANCQKSTMKMKFQQKKAKREVTVVTFYPFNAAFPKVYGSRRGEHFVRAQGLDVSQIVPVSINIVISWGNMSVAKIVLRLRPWSWRDMFLMQKFESPEKSYEMTGLKEKLVDRFYCPNCILSALVWAVIEWCAR